MISKFRVWDSYKREMIHWSELERKGFEPLCSALKGKALFLTSLPFTGIQDDKGKDIYLGDIVRLNDSYVAEVVFLGCAFSVVTKSVYSNREKDVSIISAFESIKVIGNVQQNPELLERNNE